ncbi:hypothetical protein MNBD_ALPHA11-1053 [hydrothermal vent metagenome]|uniref:Uncharacterized protein n=1 Tax=hydrothermal vent metagenome TaxID=652676 RepID=A0A3B0UAX9_9ZZZZ
MGAVRRAAQNIGSALRLDLIFLICFQVMTRPWLGDIVR